MSQDSYKKGFSRWTWNVFLSFLPKRMTVIIKMMNETLNENTYREIEAYTLSQMAKLENSNHNDEHVVRVKNNALKILTLLGIEGQVDKNLLKAICLLHDFTYTVKKPGMYTYIFEGQIEKRIVQPVLTKYQMKLKK